MSQDELEIAGEFDLDDPRRTVQHGEIILSKPCLKKIYEDWYAELLSHARSAPSGKMLEIGSGGGFIKEMDDSVITSDILDLPMVDMTFSAEEMPFEDGELSAIMMINVFHHIPDVRKFLSEAGRSLMKGGIVAMIEPANTAISRFIYKRFHHELFDEKRDWTFPVTGPLSGSNQALPYIVFDRDRETFEKDFPQLELGRMRFHTAYRYLFSGGLSRGQLLPDFLFPVLKKFELILPRQTSLFQTIVLTKNG